MTIVGRILSSYNRTVAKMAATGPSFSLVKTYGLQGVALRSYTRARVLLLMIDSWTYYTLYLELSDFSVYIQSCLE